jgi:hypothetical protein
VLVETQEPGSNTEPGSVLEPGFVSLGPPSAKARIWFGLHVTSDPTRQVPPNQVRFGVPNLIRATEDTRPVTSRDLREPDSGVSVAQRKLEGALCSSARLASIVARAVRKVDPCASQS